MRVAADTSWPLRVCITFIAKLLLVIGICWGRVTFAGMFMLANEIA